MEAETKSLLDRVSQRLGLGQSRDLVQLEEQLKQNVTKNKMYIQPASLKSSLDDTDGSVFEACFQQLYLCDSDTDLSRRNSIKSAEEKRKWAKAETLTSSVTLITKEVEVTEKDEIYREKEKNVGAHTQKPKQRSTVSVLDSSDEEFEMFLSQMKTPKTTVAPVQAKQNNSLQDFIVDLEKDNVSFTRNKNWIGRKKVLKDYPSQETSITTEKKNRPLEDRITLVLTSESDDDENFIIKSCKDNKKGQQEKSNLVSGSYSVNHRLNSYSHLEREKEFKEPAVCRRTNSVVQNDVLKIAESSDDEFEVLMEKVKTRTKPQTPRSTAKKIPPRLASKDVESFISPSETVNCTFEETKKPCIPKPKSLPRTDIASRQLHPEWNPKIRSVSCSEQIISSDRWNVPCQVPGCFLQELSNPTSAFVKNFKQKKEELAQKLYVLYNSSIFNQELPEKMEIIWNKNMRKTAGYCVTGLQKEQGMLRYAKIELSEKVCDSADRLRDTLIHELCHAATWLINGLRDGHGQFWKLYAKKSTVVHPELPVVSRCHSYEINYKFSYKCTHCGTTIGRHSKSLDTQRFVCALCQGKLVLFRSACRDGTLTKTQLTPFAKLMKENCTSGLKHSKLMRKLSAEFTANMHISDS